MKEDIKTGTTTIGLICKDGIVLAADKRASAGYLVAEKKMDKILPITDDIAVTTAGSVSDVQMLIKLIKAQIRLVSFRRSKNLSVKEATNLLASMVYNSIRRPSMVPSITGFLVGGRDPEGFHLYNIGVAGSIIKSNDYKADGSGMQFALGVLESSYKKDLPLKEAIKLAVKAVNTAIQRDIASGNGIDVVTITKDGVQRVLEKEINTNVLM